MLYTREEIDRIRTSVDLVTVVQSCGTITLESKGSSLTALCPGNFKTFGQSFQ